MQYCPWETAKYFLFSSNIPTLFYYSHIPAMVIGLIAGIIVFRKMKEASIGAWLLVITGLFFLWGFFDLLLWATNDPRVVLFFWTIQILIEPLIFLAALFMSYGFLFRKQISFKSTLILALSVVPLIVFLSTSYTLIGVSISDCNAIEGFFAHYYTYILEAIYILSILVCAFSAYRQSINIKRRPEIKFFTVGIILFLLSFSSLNIVGSFTDDWTVAQGGLIGMPIFVAFLAYIIVKFKTFNFKVFGAQILVFGLIALVSSLIFLTTTLYIPYIVAFTLLFLFIIGYQLIKSVKREVKQREQLEILSEQLFVANDKLKDLDKLKTEFLSLASHQLRSPLTAIKGYTSMVLEGDFGEINPKAKDAIERVFQSTMNLTKIVEDLLNVSKIEQGGMKYEMAPFNLAEISRDMSKDLSVVAGNKNLTLNFESDKDVDCMVNGDREKIRQVVLNFIDNSIKYTKEGSVDVSVKRVGKKVIFAVRDTGMGMTPEIKKTLFQKFARGEGGKVNSGGSGLGLYLAKEIIEAHKGTVDVTSEGLNKGSTFSFELDAVK